MNLGGRRPSSGQSIIFSGAVPTARTQFPLTIVYAITVHKSQGAMLDKAILDITERDFQPGLFDWPFDLSVLRMQANANHAIHTEENARR